MVLMSITAFKYKYSASAYIATGAEREYHGGMNQRPPISRGETLKIFALASIIKDTGWIQYVHN